MMNATFQCPACGEKWTASTEKLPFKVKPCPKGCKASSILVIKVSGVSMNLAPLNPYGQMYYSCLKDGIALGKPEPRDSEPNG